MAAKTSLMSSLDLNELCLITVWRTHSTSAFWVAGGEIKHYNFLTHCLELSADEARCFYPSPVIHKLFLDVHQQYFSSCSSSEEEEAPESVVIILTLLPVCIIPIAVYMVIKRSNVK
uniref:Receptor activity modifying protein 2 n=1 Tax=Astyanax mexicanus TaxID=7994 RepID=A0A3B1JR40_ASTMX